MFRKEKRSGIDVVVPIYNGYEDLCLCVESLQKYTDLDQDHIILIDDCSPNQKIKPYLQNLSRSGFTVLYNQENLGFSGSVNRGVCFSDRDVILLNSDTVVTAGWIDKILRCAYSDESIATVTPFSNSGTICSIPKFCEDNPIPEGFTIDQYAEVVERCSFRRYPSLSTAVGFCMFIKRSVIKEVGLFDSEAFQRGYGEENDFCWRASELGYRHALCDDTFIYHKGTVSFLSQEKAQLIEAHQQILKHRYERLLSNNAEFVQTDVNWELRENIDLYAVADPSKKNLLYVLHADFREGASDNIGGTQFHVRDLMEELRSEYNIFVAARDREYLRLTLYTGKKQVSMRFFIGPEPFYEMYTNKRISELFRGILSAFRIDLVHIHHTKGLSLDIYHETSARGIPLIATIHDYYTVCPTIKLLDAQNQFCMGRETPELCRECLWSQNKITKHLDVEYLSKWRQKYFNALALCDQLIVPSAETKRIITTYYPELAEKIRVVEHGSDFHLPSGDGLATPKRSLKMHSRFEVIPDRKNKKRLSGWAYLEDVDSRESRLYIDISDTAQKHVQIPVRGINRRDVAEAKGGNQYLLSGFSLDIPFEMLSGGTLNVRVLIENKEHFLTNGDSLTLKNSIRKHKRRLNVAFVGGLSVPKGSQLAYQMIKHGPRDINWFVFGGIGDSSLALLEQSNLTKTGWYEKDHLPILTRLYKIDLICILPIWPETFCYTLSEALLCGVPVLVTDIGAVGKRTEELNCGWILPYHANYKDFLSVLSNLCRDGADYQKKKSLVAGLRLKGIAEMAADYREIYERWLNASQHRPATENLEQVTPWIFEGYLLENEPGMNETSASYRELSTQLHMRNQELQAIQSSLGYKGLLTLRKFPIPFKRSLKQLILHIYKWFKGRKGA